MIRNTIDRTNKSTYYIKFPDPQLDNFPRPIASGFFIHPKGFFLTAAHVIDEFYKLSKTINLNIQQAHDPFGKHGCWVNGLKLIKKWDPVDLALLKASLSQNSF